MNSVRLNNSPGPGFDNRDMSGTSLNNVADTLLSNWDMAYDFFLLLSDYFLNNRDLTGVTLFLMADMLLDSWYIADAFINDLAGDGFKSVGKAVGRERCRSRETRECSSSCRKSWEGRESSRAETKQSSQVKTSWCSSSRSQTSQGIEQLQRQTSWQT